VPLTVARPEESPAADQGRCQHDPEPCQVARGSAPISTKTPRSKRATLRRRPQQLARRASVIRGDSDATGDSVVVCASDPECPDHRQNPPTVIQFERARLLGGANPCCDRQRLWIGRQRAARRHAVERKPVAGCREKDRALRRSAGAGHDEPERGRRSGDTSLRAEDVLRALRGERVGLRGRCGQHRGPDVAGPRCHVRKRQ
jgi:hypothetical protein